jgi:hypothetical protein
MSILLVIGYPIMAIFNNNVRRFYKWINKDSKLFHILQYILPKSFKPLDESNITLEVTLGLDKKLYIFNQSRFIVDIILSLTTAVSIGVIIPPVGIVICGCLYLYIHNTLCNLGYRISQTGLNKDELLKLKIILEKDCELVKETAIKNIYIFLLPLMGIFSSLFVFDTLGDDLGYELASKYSVIMIIIPVFLWIFLQIFYLIILLHKKCMANQIEDKEKFLDLELSDRHKIEYNVTIVNPLTP